VLQTWRVAKSRGRRAWRFRFPVDCEYIDADWTRKAGDKPRSATGNGSHAGKPPVTGSGAVRFDRNRMIAAAARARAIGRDDANFLEDIAAGEIAFRLSATNREFASALDCLSQGNALARLLRSERPALAVEEYGFGEWLGGANPGGRMAPQRHDLVTSLFGLHRCADPVGALTAMRGTLRPDGLFLGVLPAEGTLVELGDALMAAELACRSGAALRIEPFATLRQAGSWLQQAGFALPVAAVEKLTRRYASLGDLIGELRALGVSNCLTGARSPLPRAAYKRLENEYRKRYADSDGRLRLSVNLVYLSGWEPHASQQQPLRPGTARQSLAEALRMPRQ
jgi:hypothetical protein